MRHIVTAELGDVQPLCFLSSASVMVEVSARRQNPATKIDVFMSLSCAGLAWWK